MLDFESLKQRIQKQLQKERENVRLLMFGAGLFFSGIGLIYFSQYFLDASLQRDLLALLGLVIAAIGAILAAAGYLCILLNRLGLFRDDN